MPSTRILFSLWKRQLEQNPPPLLLRAFQGVLGLLRPTLSAGASDEAHSHRGLQ